MTKFQITLPGITGIVPGSAAETVGTFNIPILNKRVHKIQLVYIDGGSSPTDITAMFGDIIVRKNSTDQRTHTAAQLDHLNGLNGSEYLRQQVGAAAAMRQSINLFFAEPWRKDKVDADALAWPVSSAGGWNTFQVLITLLEDMPSTGSIVAYAMVDDLVQGAPAVPSLVKVYRQQIPASGTSNDITTWDERDAYQVIALTNPTGAAISAVTFKRNTDLVMDKVLRADNVAHLTALGLTPANDTTAGDFG